jgi:lysophospholipase L1-like esterase
MSNLKLEYLDPNFQAPELNGAQYAFVDVTKPPCRLSGLAWFGQEKQFRRLPANLVPATNEGVDYLSWHTSGAMVRFRTDSPNLAIRAELRDPATMPHMPASGSAGFDLYMGTGKTIKFHKNARPTNGETEVSGPLVENLSPQMRDFILYLPLYNGVKKLEIGISPEASLEAPSPFTYEKPILFYGSSITQGGCASRPGNAYTHLLTRWLDANLINLGFSGSGKGEPALAKAIASLDLSAFVMDYDHNAPNPEHLEQTHAAFFRTFRARRPDTPVVILSKCDFDSSPAANAARRDIIRKTYETARAEGDRNVYFVDGETLFGTHNRDACTVDGCHPNDLGFMRMAKGILPVLQTALDGQCQNP